MDGRVAEVSPGRESRHPTADLAQETLTIHCVKSVGEVKLEKDSVGGVPVAVAPLASNLQSHFSTKGLRYPYLKWPKVRASLFPVGNAHDFGC